MLVFLLLTQSLFQINVVDIFFTATHLVCCVLVVLEYCFLNAVAFGLQMFVLVLGMHFNGYHDCSVCISFKTGVIVTDAGYIAATSFDLVTRRIHVSADVLITRHLLYVQRRWHLC